MQDGAEWLQGLIDYHRADAVRILDFAHAAEYINDIGQAVHAAGGRLPAALAARECCTGSSTRDQHGCSSIWPGWPRAIPVPLLQEKLTYLQKREAHMQYPIYQEAGWPIGSGSVESANKLVVEARLKGAGMRWGRQNVNPDAGAAQCGVQSRVEAHLGNSMDSSARTAHARSASTESTATGAVPAGSSSVWGVRLYRLSHPSPAPATLTAQTFQKHPTARPGSGYSWHKPFLRRLPSPLCATAELGAKK